MSFPLEKGVSPPPRLDGPAVAEMETIGGKGLRQMARYLVALDQWFRSLREAFAHVRVYEQSLDLGSTPANSTASHTFTVSGLSTADIVFVNKPSYTAGLAVVGARVSAKDTLVLTTINSTAGAINPAAETYRIVAVRK